MQRRSVVAISALLAFAAAAGFVYRYLEVGRWASEPANARHIRERLTIGGTHAVGDLGDQYAGLCVQYPFLTADVRDIRVDEPWRTSLDAVIVPWEEWFASDMYWTLVMLHKDGGVSALRMSTGDVQLAEVLGHRNCFFGKHRFTITLGDAGHPPHTVTFHEP